jgi:recombination protein RecT
MATTTAVVPRKDPALPEPMVQTLQSIMPHLPTLLPPDISLAQFRAALYLELSGRPALAECTTQSLRDAVIKAATYGLLPGRDCHFLPFSNRQRGGKKDATYVPNYFGLILALERTGKIRRAFAHPVHEGDTWDFNLFQDRPVHIPAVTLGKPQGKELFYYGAVMFKDNTCAFEVVTLDELEAIKQRSPAHESGPWVTDRVMMCRKSCLKRVAKYVRLTPELGKLLDDEDTREQADIPLARHRQNLTDVFGPAAVDGPEPALPERTAAEIYVPRVEAAILANPGAEPEAWYRWAERRLAKNRTQFTAENWQWFLTQVQSQTGETPPQTEEERPDLFKLEEERAAAEGQA